MAKFFSTTTKKTLLFASLAIAGWYIVGQAFPTFWKLPEFVTKAWIGNISVLTIAGAYLLLSIYLLVDKQI